MRISDWSSDVCSSDLPHSCAGRLVIGLLTYFFRAAMSFCAWLTSSSPMVFFHFSNTGLVTFTKAVCCSGVRLVTVTPWLSMRSDEHTSELQSLMRISYAVFSLKIKTRLKTDYTTLWH